MRTEFHVHTRASHDSLMGKLALLTMCKARNVNCIAVTDHNELSGALALKPFLEAHGIAVIVGEEIFTSEGEIIGLFLNKKIDAGLTPEETVAAIRSQNGIVYVPHPYDEKRHETVLSQDAQRRLSSEFDCMEIYNGRNADSSFFERQRRIASDLQIPGVVGGDSHCFFEIGRNVCITEEPFERESFGKVLASSRFEISPCHPLAHVTTKVVRLVKMIEGRDFHGIHRVLVHKFTR